MTTLNEFIVFSELQTSHFYIEYNKAKKSDTVIYTFRNFNIIITENYKAPKEYNLLFKEDRETTALTLPNLNIDILIIAKTLEKTNKFKKTISAFKNFNEEMLEIIVNENRIKVDREGFYAI